MRDQIKHIITKFKEDKIYLVLLCLYTFLFLFFSSKMSPLYPINEWSDINIYFNMGKAMMNGRTLYTEAFDHKGPLIFFIYGIGYLLSNGSFLGMFIIQLILWILLATAVFYIAKRFLSVVFAAVASMLTLYAMLSFMHTGGSAEEFVLIFSIISLLLFIQTFTSSQKTVPSLYMLLHGILSASVILIKLNLVIFWIFPLAAIFLQLLLNKEYKNFATNLAAYILGMSIVFVPILIYFYATNALNEAYHVYIELNKQYSATDDYLYLFTNGINKLATTFRANLVWFLVLFVGIFYFPFQSIKPNIYRIALILSGLGLIGFVFFTLTFHFYYPLALFVFTPLGLISIFIYLDQYLVVKNPYKITVLATLVILIAAIGNRNFYGLGGAALFRISAPNGPQFQFKEEILKEDQPTLLNVAFGEGNAIFTSCDIVPSVKYFISPNIYYNMYPDIRDNQTKYIEDRAVDFIVSSSEGFNFDYFEQLEALQINYNKIDSVSSDGAIYYLYKKK